MALRRDTMKRPSLVQSRFRLVYTALAILWSTAVTGATVATLIWILPQLKRERVAAAEGLVRSHHEDLLYKNHRSLRDELVRQKMIADDRDFELLWPDSDSEAIRQYQCEPMSSRTCVGDTFALIQESSFAVLLKTSYFSKIRGEPLWVFGPPLILTLIFGAIMAAIRKQELFLMRKIQQLIDSQSIPPDQDEFEAISAKITREKARAELAAQVSHDIRSPLSALLAVASTAEGIDEGSRRLLDSAASRIREIADDLLRKNREQKAEPALIRPILEPVIEEKQIQHKVDISLNSQSDFRAIVQPGELKRILSNLIENAIDAGATQVNIAQNKSRGYLQISDNGRGIPRELIDRVFERGASFGKSNGNGLGLSHAKATIEAWGGKIRLESKNGTTVTIELPIAPGTLKVPQTAVILDDDPSIHELWKTKLRNKTLHHFYDRDSVIQWYRASVGEENPLYLFDYDLKAQQTGLDIIEMLGIESEAILVTAQPEKIRERCEKRGIKLLAKEEIASLSVI